MPSPRPGATSAHAPGAASRRATTAGQRQPASEARLAANRGNAQRSTGPRTAAGRQVSSRNATRHGVLARTPLLPGEDPAELEALSAGLTERLGPEGGVEELLLDELVGVLWRLRRLARVELGLYAMGLEAPVLRALSGAGEASAALGVAFSSQAASFAVLTRYESALVNRLRRALADLERLQAAREAAFPGLVVVTGGG